MQKLTVAVIFGGQSSEHEVSCMSATNIISALDYDKYEIIPVGITKTGNWRIYHGPTEYIKTAGNNMAGRMEFWAKTFYAPTNLWWQN